MFSVDITLEEFKKATITGHLYLWLRKTRTEKSRDDDDDDDDDDDETVAFEKIRFQKNSRLH